MRCLLFIVFILVFTSCDRTTQRLKNFEVHGIDVSRYQEYIDWEKIKAQNIHFAFAKATEGLEHRDTAFLFNWEEMRRVGITRGAYHFFRPTLSATKQAENFIRLVKLEKGDLPPVLDIEVTDGVPPAELLNGIRTWLFQVEIHYNVKPVIYTNQDFFNKYIAGHFDDYPLWIARYNTWFKPFIRNNKKWLFWQYGNRGKLEGIQGDVDFNVFNGSFSDFEKIRISGNFEISMRD